MKYLILLLAPLSIAIIMAHCVVAVLQAGPAVSTYQPVESDVIYSANIPAEIVTSYAVENEIYSADIPDEPVCSYVYSLTDPAIPIPCKMVQGIQLVWLECESRDAAVTGDPGRAVGAAGELGAAQVHPIHRGAMQRLGLVFESERDRVIFSVEYLWMPTEDFRHWSCN